MTSIQKMELIMEDGNSVTLQSFFFRGMKMIENRKELTEKTIVVLMHVGPVL